MTPPPAAMGGQSMNQGIPAAKPMGGQAPGVPAPIKEKKKGGGAIIGVIVGILIALIAVFVVLLGMNFGWFVKTKSIDVSKTKLRMDVGDSEVIEIKNYDDELKGVYLQYETGDKKIVKIEEEYDDAVKIKAAKKGKTEITISGKNCDPVTVTVTVSD